MDVRANTRRGIGIPLFREVSLIILVAFVPAHPAKADPSSLAGGRICFQETGEAISDLWRNRVYSEWNSSFKLWLQEKREGKRVAPRAINAFVQDGDVGRSADLIAQFTKAKLEEIAAGSKDPGVALNAVYRMVFRAYYLVEEFRNHGFGHFFAMRTPGPSPDGKGIPLSDRMLGLSCRYARDVLTETIQQTPLAATRNGSEAAETIRLLLASGEVPGEVAKVAREEARNVWRQLPAQFVEYYAAIVRMQLYYQDLAGGMRGINPLRSASPISGWVGLSDLSEGGVPGFAKGYEGLFGRFIESELKVVGLLVGQGNFEETGVSSEEKGRILRMAVPRSEKELTQETDSLYETLRSQFERLTFSSDRRVSTFLKVFDGMFREDYPALASGAEREEVPDLDPSFWLARNVKPHLKKLQSRNREYEIAIDGLSKLKHPAALERFMSLGSLNRDSFPPWVAELARARYDAEKRLPLLLAAWYKPVRDATCGIAGLMEALSPQEVRALHHWLSKQEDSLAALSTFGWFRGSNLEYLVNQKLEALAVLFDYEQQSSSNSVRGDRGVADPPYNYDEIDLISKGAEWNTFKNKWAHTLDRGFWFVQEHKLTAAFVVGGVIGLGVLMHAVPALSVPLAYAFITMAVAYPVTLIAKMALGRINPQGRFGVVGMEAGVTLSQFTDDTLLNAVAVVSVLAPTVLKYRRFAAAYRVLGKPYGSRVLALPEGAMAKEIQATKALQAAFVKSDHLLTLRGRNSFLEQLFRQGIRSAFNVDMLDARP